MRKLELICIVAVSLEFACDIWFAAKPNTDLQLIGMAITLATIALLLISFISGIIFIRRDKIRALVPFGICLLGFPTSIIVGSYLGNWVRDWRFQKNLARYNEVVRLVEKAEIKTGLLSSRIDLPPQYSDLAIIALGKTNSTGNATIEFIIGGGFPVKHSGYLYIWNGKVESDPDAQRRWPYRSQIDSNWFRISD